MHPTTPASPVPRGEDKEGLRYEPVSGRREKKDKLKDELKLDLESEESKKKPAILNSEGTTQKMYFMERQKPVPPPSSLKKSFKRKLKGTCKYSTFCKIYCCNLKEWTTMQDTFLNGCIQITPSKF